MVSSTKSEFNNNYIIKLWCWEHVKVTSAPSPALSGHVNLLLQVNQFSASCYFLTTYLITCHLKWGQHYKILLSDTSFVHRGRRKEACWHGPQTRVLRGLQERFLQVVCNQCHPNQISGLEHFGFKLAYTFLSSIKEYLTWYGLWLLHSSLQ